MISKTDIKLVQSKRLTDDDNGGGVITGKEIADGVINNLYPDISRLDRTLGKVSLAKAFVLVDTDTTDTYRGVHVIISEPQSDPGVDLLLMNTRSDFDERLEASLKIQSPFDIDSVVDTPWLHYSSPGSGLKDHTSAYFRANNTVETLPEFSVNGIIIVGGNEYTISVLIGSYAGVTIAINETGDFSSPLAISDEFGNNRWTSSGITELGVLSNNSFNVLHDTYLPGIGDSVMINGQVLQVLSIDNSVPYTPKYHFSGKFLADIPANAVLQIPGQIKNEYSGITTLTTDVSADATQITVSETDKFIFPVGSEGLDSDIIGLDPSALPANKRVSIIDPNRVIVIHSSSTESLTDPAVLGNTYALSGTDYQLIELLDSADIQVNPVLYTVDLVAGSVTIESGVDLSAYTQPFVAQKRREDIRLVTDVDHATKVVTLGRPLSQAFTANTFVSSAVIFGDLVSSYANFFDQQTWTGEWHDEVSGNNASATYNDTAYSLQVTNASAVTENWALPLDSETTFDIIGEHVGHVGTGQTDAAPGTFTAPINPETGEPYFKLPQEGWGSGWSIGNVLRFKTIGCSAPLWFIRITQQSDDTVELTDKFTIQIRGDAN